MKENENIADLEELIELAEKVSNNIDALTKKKRLSIIYVILTFVIFSLVYAGFVIAYHLLIPEKVLLNSLLAGILLGATLILFGVIIIKLLLEYRAITFKIKNELLILGDLLDVTHSIKETESKKIGTVKKYLWDMKLSRIGFSGK